MSTTHTATSDTKIIAQEMAAILLDELNGIFRLFQDGIIKDDTFAGGLPMSYRSNMIQRENKIIWPSCSYPRRHAAYSTYSQKTRGKSP